MIFDRHLNEPPFITALRGIVSDVANSTDFHGRLSHIQRLPSVFDRLSSSGPRDVPRAVSFLCNHDPNEDSASLLAKFGELVFADEMRKVEASSLQSFLRFCAIVVDHLSSKFDERSSSRIDVRNAGDALKLVVSAALRLLLSQGEIISGEAEKLTTDHLALKCSFDVVEKMVKMRREDLALQILTNEDFFRLMISDSPVVSILSVSLFTVCISQPSFRLSSLSSSTLADFLDELSFKISSTDDSADASTSIQALSRIAEKGKDFVDLIRSRYEGLETLLTRWASRGFDPTIRRLLSLLHPSTASDSKNLKTKNSAAVVIQKTWRGHVIRRRIINLERIVSRVQRSFKRRRDAMLQAAVDANDAALNSSVLETTRLKQLRESREEALRSVKSLPAKEVDEFLRRREAEAATKIQAIWNGWKTRDKMAGKEALKREAAARVLQRHSRAWLKKIRARKAVARSESLTGDYSSEGDFTKDDRRERLLQEVERKKERRLKAMRAKQSERLSEGVVEGLSRKELNELDTQVRNSVAEKDGRKSGVSRSLLRCRVS